MTAFGLASEAVNAPSPLFDSAGVPRKIVVNNVTAESLKVNPLFPLCLTSS